MEKAPLHSFELPENRTLEEKRHERYSRRALAKTFSKKHRSALHRSDPVSLPKIVTFRKMLTTNRLRFSRPDSCNLV